MKLVLSAFAALAALSPVAALACPMSRAAGDCASCSGSSSVVGYGAALLLGLGIGVASVAFERK
jgi:hypothetical protein